MKITQSGCEMEVTLSTGGGRFELPLTYSGGNDIIQGTVGEISRDVKLVTIKMAVPTFIAGTVYSYRMTYGSNKTEALDRTEGEVWTSFSLDVPLQWGKDKIPQPPTNGGQSLRLLSIENGGRLHDLVISLVKQGDQMFVVVQETYNEQLYRAGDLVVCPPMEQTRLHTLETVRRMLEDNAEFVSSLPEKSTYQRPDLKKKALSLRAGEGLVLWFADGMNSGAVLAKDFRGNPRQFKVHFSWIMIKRFGGRRYLRAGEKVLFRGTEEIPGNSKFRSQLTDVTVEGAFPGLISLNLSFEEKEFQIS